MRAAPRMRLGDRPLCLPRSLFLLAHAVAGEATRFLGERDGKELVTVRATEATTSKQALPNFPGISGKTAGAKSFSLLKVVIPPGGSAGGPCAQGL